MIDINIEIFKRTSPDKKLEMIKNLSVSEINRVKQSTILRIIREAGAGRKKSRYKTLNLSGNSGNHWNSTIERVCIGKAGSILIDVYMQSDHTDRTCSYKYEEFFKSGTFVASMTELDRYGNNKYCYARYDETNKIEVIRDILTSYITTKYADKLKEISAKKKSITKTTTNKKKKTNKYKDKYVEAFVTISTLKNMADSIKFDAVDYGYNEIKRKAEEMINLCSDAMKKLKK